VEALAFIRILPRRGRGIISSSSSSRDVTRAPVPLRGTLIERHVPRVARCCASLHPWLQSTAPPGPKATSIFAPAGRRHVATGEAQRNPWNRMWCYLSPAPAGQRNCPIGTPLTRTHTSRRTPRRERGASAAVPTGSSPSGDGRSARQCTSSLPPPATC
jgi:hypothetical protein